MLDQTQQLGNHPIDAWAESFDLRARDFGEHLEQVQHILQELKQLLILRDARGTFETDALPVAPARALTLRLLGAVELVWGERAILIRRRGKAESVLKALALHPSRFLLSDTLAELVWPGTDPDEARHSLHTTVSMLRRTLARAGCDLELVHSDREGYRLDAEVATDVDAFDVLYRRGLAHERRGETELAVAAFGEALSLYRDDLQVDEFPDLNLMIERERIAGTHLNMLSKVAAHHYRLRRLDESLVYAGRLLARDPSREDAHRLVMGCYFDLGQRAQALHQYNVCREVLRRVFDTEPEPATTELYERILRA
jgi:DNA-binding SARP family transcriptional activator